MIPDQPLPYGNDFASADDYVNDLLHFVHTSETHQILCGGIHIVDFFTTEPGLFRSALPETWHSYLLSCDMMNLLDLFLREDLTSVRQERGQGPPDSLLEYVKDIRKFSLRRNFSPPPWEPPVLPRSVAVGMKPKKMHEVAHFARFVEGLADHIAASSKREITHFVDFGSGQNYFGRALASAPYHRHVVAVEGREDNVVAARGLDRVSGLAVKQRVMRNKKLWNQISVAQASLPDGGAEAGTDAIKGIAGAEAFDFRPMAQLKSHYVMEEGKGHVQYVAGRLVSGELGDIIAKLDALHLVGGSGGQQRPGKVDIMAVSIHSCGNLSHFGIRSLVLNTQIRAVAIVGCCYNLMTEKLGPPTYKHPHLRPSLQVVNGRVSRESEKRDPQGFPMSRLFTDYGGRGVRSNITARMMACQAPQNWTRADSDGFFTRHFFRAVLQKIFLDRGVVSRVRHGEAGGGGDVERDHPLNMSTEPITIGSLRKQCYRCLRTYVRGVVEKLTTSLEYKQYATVMRDKMADMTDAEIDRYEAEYLPRKGELCVIWTLMALSAMVVESLIVVDRWMFLKEHRPLVKYAWVETVFDYKQSPRNLVVVGLKEDP